MLKKIFFSAILSIIVAGATISMVYAQPISDEQLGLSVGIATGLPAADIRLTVARIIRVAMSLLGIVAVVIVLIGGFTWMTAGGNDDKIAEAKKWITAGVIGLAIILSAYSLTTFIIKGLVRATQGG